MDPDLLSETLEALSSDQDARKKGQHVRTLRGLRGVPDGEVAQVLAAAWHEERPTLPDDAWALNQLYGSAHEDGLVAIGLAAALVPDRPREVLEFGLDLLDRVDDLETADALGWVLLGPAALACDALDLLLARTRDHDHEAARRAGVVAGLAMTTGTVRGPAASALRERLGTKRVQLVDRALSDHLATWADAFLRDDSPSVRKGLRRLLRLWTKGDAPAVVRWADRVGGGLPKLLKKETDRARRRAERESS